MTARMREGELQFEFSGATSVTRLDVQGSANQWLFDTRCENRGGCMLKSVEGVYRDGKIELTELPGDVQDETRVIVTFLETNLIDLRARGINETQAVELRAQLGTFAEEWDSPEMELYNNYDAAKAKL